MLGGVHPVQDNEGLPRGTVGRILVGHGDDAPVGKDAEAAVVDGVAVNVAGQPVDDLLGPAPVSFRSPKMLPLFVKK